VLVESGKFSLSHNGIVEVIVRFTVILASIIKLKAIFFKKLNLNLVKIICLSSQLKYILRGIIYGYIIRPIFCISPSLLVR